MTRQKDKRGKEPEYLYELGVAKAAEIRTERAMNRWAQALVRAQGYQFPHYLGVTGHMEAALKAMQRTVNALSRVPADWKPAVGSHSRPIEKGTRVWIKEARRGLYFFIPDPSKPIEVVALHGSKVVCLVSTGKDGSLNGNIFPRAHLQLIAPGDSE